MRDTILIELAANTRAMLSFDRMVTIAWWLMQTEGVLGDVCEFGCYLGNTAALMAGLTKREIWLYDSFQGLPNPAVPDEDREEKYQKGSMQASEAEVIHTFMSAGLPTSPKIIKAWFHEITDSQLPPQMSFVHIDGDFYYSIYDALRLAYPRLSKDGVIVVDDYGDPGLPGVQTAVREFLSDKPEVALVPQGINGNRVHQCFFVKQ